MEGHSTFGGYSYLAIKPIALRMVAEIALDQPGFTISGIGGVTSAADAIEHMLVGATTVQSCTGPMLQGFDMVKELIEGLEAHLEKHNFAHVDDARGFSLPYFTTHHHLVELQAEKKARKAAQQRAAENGAADAAAAAAANRPRRRRGQLHNRHAPEAVQQQPRAAAAAQLRKTSTGKRGGQARLAKILGEGRQRAASGAQRPDANRGFPVAIRARRAKQAGHKVVVGEAHAAAHARGVRRSIGVHLHT